MTPLRDAGFLLSSPWKVIMNPGQPSTCDLVHPLSGPIIGHLPHAYRNSLKVWSLECLWSASFNDIKMITCLEFWVTSPWYHTCSRQIASNRHVFFPSQPVSPSTPTSSRCANVAAAANNGATTRGGGRGAIKLPRSRKNINPMQNDASNMIGFIMVYLWTTLWKPFCEYDIC